MGAAVFFASEDESVCYGAQGSSLQINFAPFITVQDSDSPNAGPAFYFQQFYDKLVVLPEDTWDASALPTSSSSSKKAKRQFPQIDPGWLHQRQVAQPGDKPWFCVWNKTFIEGFVYVQQPVATSFSLSSSLLTPTPSLNTSLPTTSSSPRTSTSPVPTQMVTSTYAGQFFTSTWTGPASAYSEFPVRAADREREYEKVYTVDNDDDDDHAHDDDNDDSYRRSPNAGASKKTSSTNPWTCTPTSSSWRSVVCPGTPSRRTANNTRSSTTAPTTGWKRTMADRSCLNSMRKTPAMPTTIVGWYLAVATVSGSADSRAGIAK